MRSFAFVLGLLKLFYLELAIGDPLFEVLLAIWRDISFTAIESSSDDAYLMLYRSLITPIVFAQLQW